MAMTDSKSRALVLGFTLTALLCAAQARADVFFPPLLTSGTWSILGPSTDACVMWADCQSYDNDHNNALDLYGGQQWSYLHAAGDPTQPASFAWRGPLDNRSEEMGITAFKDGRWGFDPVTGLFSYDAHTDDIDRRTDSGNNPRNYLLLARQTGVNDYLLLVLVEDLLYGSYDRIDSDVTDNVLRFTYTRPPTTPPVEEPVCIDDCASGTPDHPNEPPQVAEPGLLLLTAFGMLACGRRMQRARRIAWE